MVKNACVNRHKFFWSKSLWNRKNNSSLRGI
nr:MAG TPA: hypothetical protein [Caudoviricetes sp.]